MEVAAPTVAVVAPSDRDYGSLLQQTKMVYDQLLADKHSKLTAGLLQRKQQYDNKCAELHAQNSDNALEFGVRAQSALIQLRKDLCDELAELQTDYQAKLNHMQEELEVKWRSEQPKKMAPKPGIFSKVFKQK